MAAVGVSSYQQSSPHLFGLGEQWPIRPHKDSRHHQVLFSCCWVRPLLPLSSSCLLWPACVPHLSHTGWDSWPYRAISVSLGQGCGLP